VADGLDFRRADDGPLAEKGNIVYAYLLSCVAAVGGLLFGYACEIENSDSCKSACLF